MILAAAVLVATTALSQPADARTQAIALARNGQTAEALQLFESILARDPADAEAKFWVALLDLRLGRVDKAEAGFRAVLASHPKDVDARIGLGNVLVRKGAWKEALEVLHAAEPDAGANGDLFAALARASRRAGDDRAALDYYERALAVSRADPDVVDGYEAVARTYGHWVAVEGFGQRVAPGGSTGSGSVQLDVRVHPRVHLQGEFRAQAGDGYSDTLGAGGFLWRAGRATNLSFRAAGGPDNVAMPRADVGGFVMHYVGIAEVGVSARTLWFGTSSVRTLSPVLAVDSGGRWRFEGRYSYSRSHFSRLDTAMGNHSGVARATLRRWRRVWLNGSYAYGIESFENLTADRLGRLGANTVAGGFRANLRSLTVLNASWEHQWRSNGSTLERLAMSVVQSFP